MVLSAVFIGKAFRQRDLKQKNSVLIVSAVMIDSFEIFKIVLLCFRQQDAMHWINVLPLFLCSIHLITIPLAAFSKGRIKEASLDFVMIFGLVGAVLGIFCAGNNFGFYPVLCFDNVVSGITHAISGFSALYIMISDMVSMKKSNIGVTIGILGFFCTAAFIANHFVDCNYMFLTRGDGTPYDIVFNLVNGNQILYPILVVALFLIYIAGFYSVYYVLQNRKQKENKRMQDANTNYINV